MKRYKYKEAEHHQEDKGTAGHSISQCLFRFEFVTSVSSNVQYWLCTYAFIHEKQKVYINWKDKFIFVKE